MAVQNYVGALALKAVDWFAAERIEVLILALPEKQATDVLIAEDGTHELVDIPRLPLEIALKVWNDVLTVPQAGDHVVEANLIGLPGILPVGAPLSAF